MIRLGLQRHHGKVTGLGTGCWVADGIKVYFRCVECDALHSALVRDVAANGDVDFGPLDGPLFFCQAPGCSFARGIRFEGWQPPQKFDLSDGGS